MLTSISKSLLGGKILNMRIPNFELLKGLLRGADEGDEAYLERVLLAMRPFQYDVNSRGSVRGAGIEKRSRTRARSRLYRS